MGVSVAGARGCPGAAQPWGDQLPPFGPAAPPRVKPSGVDDPEGDSHYGVSWHRMSPEYDSGPILAQRSTPVLVEDTIYDVVPRITTLGLRMLRGVFERLTEGDPDDPQPAAGVTLAGPFGEDYATIDWSTSARAVHDQVRAWTFTPGTHSVTGPTAQLDGQMVRIVRTTLRKPGDGGRRIDCGDGPLWVLEYESLDWAGARPTLSLSGR